jgi:hypothetical protein
VQPQTFGVPPPPQVTPVPVQVAEQLMPLLAWPQLSVPLALAEQVLRRWQNAVSPS